MPLPLDFARLFAAQPAISLVLDSTGRIVALTDALLELLGSSREVLLGLPLAEALLGPIGSAWQEALPTVLSAGGGPTAIQPVFFPVAANSPYAAALPWWRPQVRPLFDSGGQQLEYVLCSAQQTLAPAPSSQLVSPLAPRLAELRSILEQVPGYLAALLEPNHIAAYVSPGMRLLLADKPREGRPLADTMPELVEPGIIHLFDEVYRTGEPLVLNDFPVSGIDTPSLYQSGRYFDFTFQPLRDGRQHIMGVLLFILETTDRVRLRQRLVKFEEARRREEI